MTISELQSAAEGQARATVGETIKRWQLGGVPEQAVAPLMLNELLVQVLTQTLMLAHIGVMVGAISPDPPPPGNAQSPAKEPGRIIMEH